MQKRSKGVETRQRVEIENDKIDKRGEKVKKGKERKGETRRGKEWTD